MDNALLETVKGFGILLLIVCIVVVVWIQLYVSKIDGEEKDTPFFTIVAFMRYLELTRQKTGKTGKLAYVFGLSFAGFILCLALTIILVTTR